MHCCAVICLLVVVGLLVRCVFLYSFLFCFFSFFPRVYKRKGKLVTGTDETVTWESHLSESSHTCTPL